jgi:hypothetical protein
MAMEKAETVKHGSHNASLISFSIEPPGRAGKTVSMQILTLQVEGEAWGSAFPTNFLADAANCEP